MKAIGSVSDEKCGEGWRNGVMKGRACEEKSVWVGRREETCRRDDKMCRCDGEKTCRHDDVLGVVAAGGRGLVALCREERVGRDGKKVPA